MEKDKGMGGEQNREDVKKSFSLQVINQYSSRMLPFCTIIINYTQEWSWSKKRTAQRGESGKTRNKSILFTLGDQNVENEAGNTESPDVTVATLQLFLFLLANSQDY